MSIERIKEVTEQILGRVEAAKGRGEEQTKQSLVLPMLSALGYDIWDPREVRTEHDADFATKKNGQKEKVDIAIFEGNAPIIYIETKPCDFIELADHQGQLARYFNSSPTVVLGILTNGIEWRFYTDTADPNIMDNSPFHIARLDSIDQGLDVMARFIKGQPIAETTRSYATELRYTAKIAACLKRTIDLKDQTPDEEFIRWILKCEDADEKGKAIYPGMVNINVVTRFAPIVKNALTRVIRDIVRRSVTAMDEEVTKPDTVVPDQPEKPALESSPENEPSQSSRRATTIITTEDELLLYEKIKRIFDTASQTQPIQVYEPSHRRFEPAVLGYKDTSAYFGIYINKPSWWVLRASVESIHSKWSTNWLGFDLPLERVRDALPDGMKLLPPSAYAETRVVIESIEDVDKIENIILMAIDHEVQRHKSPSDNDEPVQI